MGRYFILCFGIAMLFSLTVFSQIGEKVSSVELLNLNKDSVSIPYLGEKNLLIFYADPSHPRQNRKLRTYFKTHPINSPNIASYGVINLAAAPLIPNGTIIRMVKREMEGTKGYAYLDPDNVLSRAWNLKDASTSSAVIFVNKEQTIEFYKTGQLTKEDNDTLLSLIQKYK